MSRVHTWLPLLIGLAMVISPTVAFAQFGSADPLTITVAPAFPRPYDTITITASSNLVDLAASSVTISVNGAVIEKGMRSVQYRLGAAGSVAAIQVSAETTQGNFSAQTTVNPAEVSLVVESSSTVPLGYEGAALVPSEGRVRLVAVSNLRQGGARIPDSQVLYTWKLGSQLLEAESGIGRSVLTATAPERYRDALITVTASNQAKTINAQSSVTISPIDPLVRIYRKDPLQGVVLERALSGTFTLLGEEESFRVAPYFFKEDPSIAWTLNGSAGGVANDLTVRSSGGNGSAVLGVTASTPEAEGSAGLSIRFGGGTNIFGF